jgi:universal stress protein A
MLAFKTILHPTDFSKPSEQALRFACALARDYRARLVLVHVIEPPIHYGELGMAVPLPPDFQESLHDKLADLVPVGAGIPVETVLLEGGAASEILRLAGERHCSLIVMGTHGRTGLARVLLGSVTEEVIRRSSVPVLTLKTPMLLDDESSEKGEAGSESLRK